MPYEEFLQRLGPCIKRGDLDACFEEASRLAKEEEISAKDLLDLSSSTMRSGNPELAYVLALVAAVGLDGMDVACAFYNAGIAADIIGNKGDAIDHLKKAIEIKMPMKTSGCFKGQNPYQELLPPKLPSPYC